MNLDEFRAMKASEESEKENPQTEEIIEEPKPTEVDQPIEETIPTQEEIEIEGIGKVKLDELKNGYLRQSDYTRKTQEVSKLRKESEEAINVYNHIKSNPQLAHNVGLEPSNPVADKMNELEEKLYDLQLEKEIDTLVAKYPDFEVMDVLKIAQDKQLTNLEDAYKIYKSSNVSQPLVDMDAIKEQVKQELLKEFGIKESDKGKTIISQGANVQVKNNEPNISETEAKIARSMGITSEEYVKWRDI